MKVYDAVVVGSGAGGAVTADKLAAAGLTVLVVEEGRAATAPVEYFTLDQFRKQYRNQGQLLALGWPPIAYAEGRCFGGSTEINSGLFHRPPPDQLARWAEETGVTGLTAQGLGPYFDEVERRLSVSKFPGELPAASRLMLDGAARLGWHAEEIPRWFRHPSTDISRQSMSRTYLPAAEAAGADFLTNTWVRRIIIEHGRAVGLEVVRGDDESASPEIVRADNVFVCGGPIQSPALLLRSGVRRNVGRRLSVHPTVKAVAFTKEQINDPKDVPVAQVREFTPQFSMGGSVSTPSMLGMALLRTAVPTRIIADNWRNMSIYYSAIRSQGVGRVRVLPGMRDPLVTYRLTNRDMALLKSSLARLMDVMFSGGASEVLPVVARAQPVTSSAEIAEGIAGFSRSTADVMTVHLCGTVPMGEDRSTAAVDSQGRVLGFSNLFVNDASLLPSAPGVNPQATVMAIAARNADAFLTIHSVAQRPTANRSIP